MGRYASIYFLLLLIPATLTSLLGIRMGFELFMTPRDDEDPINYTFLFTFSSGLSIFFIAGWFFVPGFVRQAFNRGLVSSRFWKGCAIYNASLFVAALAVWVYFASAPPADLTMSLFAGLIVIPPILGFVISWACYKSS